MINLQTVLSFEGLLVAFQCCSYLLLFMRQIKNDDDDDDDDNDDDYTGLEIIF